ncbi:hypothetical protein ACW9H0_07225 [Pseudomonas monsensis]
MKKSVIFTPALSAILSLLIAGQAGADQRQVLIDVQHDSKRQVTCWITPQGGISCLPDHQLGSLPQKATPTSDAGRASQASSVQEKASLVSIPLPQDERFRL